MAKGKERERRMHVARMAAKAERLGFGIPEEVRKELKMEAVEGLGPDAAREKYLRDQEQQAK